MISRNLDSMPLQKLPMSKKTREWREANVDYIIGKAGFTSGLGNNGSTKYEEMQTYYNLYNSIYDEKDLLYVTNPFKQKDGFPATAQDYNIIKPKVDLLLGEETKRPFNFKVVRTSDDAASEIQDRAKQMLTDYIMATIMSRLGPEEAAQYQEALRTGEVMTPEAIAKYISKDYKDIAETTAVHSLNYLKNKLNLTHEFYKGWKDALIAGEEVYYIGILNGNPYLERVNPLFFSYDQSADLEFIHDAEWCCRKMIMSATQIYDRFYDKMSEKQLNDLLEMIGDTGRGGINPEVRKTSLDYPHIKTHTIGGFTTNPFDDVDDINVWHCCWKSFRKIGFVSYTNPETGQVEEVQVDESYKVTGKELNVEWSWIIEVWEGYRIGEDLYVGIQPLEYQHISADNPNAQKLPYTGVIYNNTNSRPRSLVSMMKPLQYMYIVLWYRLELAIARDKGKVSVVDVTQIPKDMGIDVNKWMHYLSALGIMFINPYEEGWCFAKNTKVLMADGSIKNIEDIRLLDEVMTPNGNKSQVVNLFRGLSEMYQITPSIGSDIQTVTADHLVRYIYRTNNGKEEVRTDKAKDLILKFKQNPYYIQRCYLERADDVVDWNNEVILDPYILGLWLGDGTTGQPEFESMDSEIVNYLYDYADSHDLKVRVRYSKESNSNTYYLSSSKNTKAGNNNKNPLIEQLRELGIYNRKDIPESYIYTSRENRLKLLAGLIDTDGSVYRPKSNRAGYIEFTQCEQRKSIIDKFVFIARSLGFKVSVKRIYSKKVKIHKNKNITITQPYYRVRIFAGKYSIPCLIKRKQLTFKPTRTVNKNYTHFTIEYKGVDNYYGIQVNERNNEFLLGDFTIVHNCIPGREGGRPATFNQFTALDLSMAPVIDQYINLMSKIEDMVSEITGITRQREGAVSTRELVGNVERSVIQSAHITEPWFWVHNQVKKEALTMLLNTSREAWKGNKQYLHYILDDATRAFITLSDSFFYEDMDVFIDDSTKNQQQIEALRNLMQPAMQNGASLLDIAEIITMDNVNMIKNRLEEIEQKRIEQQQAMEEAQAQREQQAIQMQNEIKEEELMIKEAEMDLKKYEIDQNNATKIAVAQLNAYRGSENQDVDGNGVPDVLEIGKLALDQQKANSDAATKQMELNNKRRETEMKREIENKKIELEKQRMEQEMKLQQQKDKAAMEREKVKARTALKNKVSGEK